MFSIVQFDDNFNGGVWVHSSLFQFLWGDRPTSIECVGGVVIIIHNGQLHNSVHIAERLIVELLLCMFDRIRKCVYTCIHMC